jgi:hypothetical protein
LTSYIRRASARAHRSQFGAPLQEDDVISLQRVAGTRSFFRDHAPYHAVALLDEVTKAEARSRRARDINRW